MTSARMYKVLKENIFCKMMNEENSEKVYWAL